MLSKKLLLQSDLHVFLTIVGTLIVIGCLFMYLYSSVYALETFGSTLYENIKQDKDTVYYVIHGIFTVIILQF